MRFLCEIIALPLLLVVSGCALFRAAPGEKIEESLAQARTSRNAPVAVQAPLKRILRVEPTVIPQRVTESPRRQQIWEALCECGLMSPDRRRNLNQGGFRVAVSGPTMPWELESLLHKHRQDAASHHASAAGSSDQIFFSASGNAPEAIALPEGDESVVIIREASGAEIPSDIEIPGIRDIPESDSVRCVLRLTTSDCSGGSALVHVLPEIRFGEEARRFSVSNGKESLPIRQKAIPLYEQQFDIRLFPGDSVVVGYNASKEWTPGRFFFVGDSLTFQEERLLVLRLSEIEAVEGQRSLQVNYSKW